MSDNHQSHRNVSTAPHRSNVEAPAGFMLDHKVIRLFVVLAGFFVANAMVAEFIGVKIFSLEQTLGFEAMSMSLFGVDGLGFNLTTGVILWPVVFVMTDVINEYFGIRRVRFLSFLTVGLILYAFAMVYVAMHLSPNGWWATESGLLQQPHVDNMDEAFRKVFGQGLWIIIGSVVAFLIGQLVDVLVFQRIKRATGEGKVWLRATGSTLVSQFVDSYVVLLIAFYIGADWGLGRVLAIGMVNYTYKFIVALLLTPVIYAIHGLIDRYLGHEQASALKVAAMA
jgi:uncharacterized integral membrane protein (TIGR00697 family)